MRTHTHICIYIYNYIYNYVINDIHIVFIAYYGQVSQRYSSQQRWSCMTNSVGKPLVQNWVELPSCLSHVVVTSDFPQSPRFCYCFPMVSASHPPAMYPAAAVHPSAPIAANVTSLGWLPAVPFRWGFAGHRASLHLRFIGYCRSKQTMEHQPPPGSVKLPTCDLAWVTGSEKSLTCRKHLMPRWTWVGSSSQGWSALQLPGQGRKKNGSFHWYLVPSWNLSIAPSTPLETDMYADT